MKKVASILLFIMLLSVGTAKAQAGGDVYEYATVASGYTSTGKPVIYISFSNGEFKEIEVDKNDVKPNFYFNQAPSLKNIAGMSKEGWEVLTSQIGANGWCYFLKRKQK